MLKKRIIAGLSVAAFFSLLLLSACGPALFLVLLLFSAMCQAEFYAIAKKCGCPAISSLGVVLGSAWLLLIYFFGDCIRWIPVYAFAALFSVPMALVLGNKREKPLQRTASTLFGVLYIPVLMGFFLKIASMGSAAPHVMERGNLFLVTACVLVVKLGDTGAFAVGTYCANHKGTHPFFAAISPKKSWEGFFGGLAASILAGLAVMFLASAFEWGPEGLFYGEGRCIGPMRAILVSAALSLTGVFGDLIESMFKRSASVKDSAAIFPGMGGLLDVADSLLFVPVLVFSLLPL